MNGTERLVPLCKCNTIVYRGTVSQYIFDYYVCVFYVTLNKYICIVSCIIIVYPDSFHSLYLYAIHMRFSLLQIVTCVCIFFLFILAACLCIKYTEFVLLKMAALINT